MTVPDPAPEELIVRATHVEAPSRDWRDEDESADGAEEAFSPAGGGPREPSSAPDLDAEEDAEEERSRASRTRTPPT